MVGTISRTARVSVARRNLKEAAGKVPARRTEIAYEAAVAGKTYSSVSGSRERARSER